jgi:hypothetical protein
MKSVLMICLALVSFVSWNAFGALGRESHGIFPIQVECAPEPGRDSPYQVTLDLQNQSYASGVLRVKGESPRGMRCVDAAATRNLGEQIEPTVFCSQAQKAEYMLEVLESQTDALVKVWKLQGDRKAILVDNLPCR